MAFKNPTVQKIWLGLNNNIYLPLMTFLDSLVTSGAGWPVVRAMTAAGLQANAYVAATQTKTANANGAMATVDGVALAVGDLFWDKNAATGSERGLFKVVSIGGASSKWSAKRDDSASASAQFVDGKGVEVGGEGAANGGEVFFLTNATFVLDTDTPALARETGVVHVDDAQSITGIKKFAQLALAVWNAGKTFAASLTFAGTANRTLTIPDVDTTIAQAGVASGATAPAFTGGAGPAFTGTAQSYAGWVRVQAPIAAELVTVAAQQNIANAPATIAAQPAYPRKLSIVVTDANSSITAGIITIVGVGPGGEAIAGEVINIANGGTHTYTTANAYAKVTSITPSGLVGIDVGTDKIQAGVATAIGLPIPSGATSVSVYKEGVAATGSATSADEAVGTVDTTARTVVPTTLPDATKSFDFWFSYQLTPVGTVASPTGTVASHTHLQT